MKPSPYRYFVTGTDTGAGKTFVTAAIARRARQLGKKVFAFKPVETGCEPLGGQLVGPDMEIISKAAGDWQTDELRGLYRLTQPLAPAVAAKLDGIEIDVERIVATSKSSDAEVVLVEGAGGWRVPVTDEVDMAGLAKRLDARVVIAARAGLGTINHSLLTIEAVERDGLSIAAVVMSRRPGEDREFARSNCHEISRRWPGSVVLFDTDLSELDPLLR